jgi:hypothetical protein
MKQTDIKILYFYIVSKIENFYQIEDSRALICKIIPFVSEGHFFFGLKKNKETILNKDTPLLTIISKVYEEKIGSRLNEHCA